MFYAVGYTNNGANEKRLGPFDTIDEARKAGMREQGATRGFAFSGIVGDNGVYVYHNSRACNSSNPVVRKAMNAVARNSAYTNYKNFKLMKASAEAELGGLIRSVIDAGNNIANDARGFKNVSDATELEKGYIDTCVSKCEKALREVKERLERQLNNVMQ